MTKSLVPRRKFLGYLASGLSPLGAMTACGGGSDGGSSAPENERAVKPLITYLEYPANADQARTLTVEQELTALTPVPDRFGAGSYCLSFASAGSRAVVVSLPMIDGGDFAVSFWALTAVTHPMRVLTLASPVGTGLTVDINGQAAISVSCNAAEAPTLSTGNSGDLADGSWHHVAVQRLGALVQLFVDGAAQGSSAPATIVRPFTRLQVGGIDGLPWEGSIDDMRLHNRAFGTADIPRMVYSWAQVKPGNRADSVAAYYPFDGDAHNNTGKGFNGQLLDVTPVPDRFGNPAGAFSFNGVDSYIELQDSFDTPTEDFAIAFWVRSSSRTRMTALSISPGASDIAFVFNDGLALKFVVDGHADPLIAAGASGEFTDGRWHFVLLQRSGPTLTLYVDRQARGATDQALDPYGPGSVVRIGRSSEAAGQAPSFWSGEIDDLQIYECSFTAQEIKDLELLQFRPRDGAGALIFADRMWLLGGWNAADAQPTNNEVWSSADGFNWTFVAYAPWEGRHAAGWLVFEGKLWVIGGDNNRGHYQNDVWSSADGIHWDFITDQVPWAGRATHYTVAFGNRMWLMGGQELFSENGQDVAWNDVYSSTDGLTWSLETPHASWSPRGLILGSVAFRNRIWLIGGGTYDVRTYNNDVWSSADGIHWELVVEKAPWSPRQYHSVTVFDNKIWVLAGSDIDHPPGTNDVWYSADGQTWTHVEGSPWIARHAVSVMAYRNGLWIVAGSSAAVYNDVWRLGYAA